MTAVFTYETYSIYVFHILAIFLLLFVNTAIWLKARKSTLLVVYMILQGIILLWMVAKLFKTIAPDAALKFFFVVCQYAGVCFLGEAFFIFAYLYAKKSMPSRGLILLMAIPSFLFWAVVATNPMHHLFYRHFDFWGDSFGPAFYIHQGYNYLLIVLGFILCARNYRKQFRNEKIKATLLGIAIFIPIIANLLYIFGWFRLIFGVSPPFDITPMACTLSLMIFALAIFRFGFFDALKIARSEALSLIPDALLLVDADQRIIDYNKTFDNLLKKGELDGKDDNGALTRYPQKRLKLYQKMVFLQNSLKPSDLTYETHRGRYFRVICSAVRYREREIGLSLRFIDCTDYLKMLTEVEQKNAELAAMNSMLKEKAQLLRQLAAVRTRNEIAAEAHDVLGHSIVLVISLLEVARLSKHEPQQYIARARKLLAGTLEQLSTGQVNEAEKEGIFTRLESLVQDAELSSIQIDILCPGTLPRLKKEVEDTVYRLCREAVTNAVRHGKAGHIHIVLREVYAELEVLIIDNGMGCKAFHKGIGITAMERRLSRLNGLLLFNSLADGGFCVRAVIPQQTK